jgi:hypothetical protein
VSVNKPFITSTPPAVDGPAVDNNKGNQVSYNGYFAWEFLDREEISNAFYAWSYYGKKRVLNIGAGFQHNPHGTLSQPVKGAFESHAITALGADIFYDEPVGNPSRDMTFTLYIVLRQHASIQYYRQNHF